MFGSKCYFQLKAAMGGKKDVFEHINIEWDLIFDEPQDMVDYSEDEADVSINDILKNPSVKL